ncbi:unnamed protein product [Gongylonema pulchrum]|uniref:Uncharacterized protein n=1 Tax=Gongylonema pulchrum TaxID=637853 RepID=A0A183DG00_9BILA|nr:unnamed protein product [Gongylonema pulchrum]
MDSEDSLEYVGNDARLVDTYIWSHREWSDITEFAEYLIIFEKLGQIEWNELFCTGKGSLGRGKGLIFRHIIMERPIPASKGRADLQPSIQWLLLESFGLLL